MAAAAIDLSHAPEEATYEKRIEDDQLIHDKRCTSSTVLRRKHSLKQACGGGGENVFSQRAAAKEPDFLTHEYRRIRRMMTFILARIDEPKKGKKCRILRRICYVVVIGSILNAIYIGLLNCWLVIYGNLDKAAVVSSIMLISILSLEIMSICCLLPAMRNGGFRQFIELLNLVTKGEGTWRYQKQLRRQNNIFFGMTIPLFVYMSVFMLMNIYGAATFDNQMFRAYYFEDKWGLSTIGWMYLGAPGNFALLLYCFAIRAANCEVIFFNERLRNIGGVDDGALIASLSGCIEQHTRLAHALQLLNRLVQRFAFVSLTLLIPCTIFSLFTILSHWNAPLSELVLLSPSLLLCFVSYVCVTFFPASLHENIYKSRAILCNNHGVWQPFRPKVYIAALSLVAHLEHADTDITVWGFAVLSKPLILTTISVVVSCLAFLLQFGDCSSHPNQDSSCNCTQHIADSPSLNILQPF